MSTAATKLGRLVHHARTSVGMSRQINQDYFVTAQVRLYDDAEDQPIDSNAPAYQTAYLMAVADGLGGHAAGEVASRKAINALCQHLRPLSGQRQRLTPANIAQRLEDAVHFANQEVLRAGKTRPDRFGMATTLTVAVVWKDAGWIAHCGDTRCYQLDCDGIHQLTRDHTLGAFAASPPDVNGHPTDHVLWNCLGGKRKRVLCVDMAPVQLDEGDHLLVCSDGLTLHVRDDDIKFVLQQSSSPEDASRELVDIANLRGGNDNITLVVGRWESGKALSDSSEAVADPGEVAQ